MTNDERGELVATMHLMAVMLDGLLDLTDKLTQALEAGVKPSPEHIAELKQQAALWREQLDRMRPRLASVKIEPPTRVQ